MDITRGEGGENRKILYVDVPARPQNFDFPYTYVCPDSPPINIPISYKKKHPILFILGAFDGNLLKIHPIFVN